MRCNVRVLLLKEFLKIMEFKFKYRVLYKKIMNVNHKQKINCIKL